MNIKHNITSHNLWLLNLQEGKKRQKILYTSEYEQHNSLYQSCTRQTQFSIQQIRKKIRVVQVTWLKKLG